MPPPRGHSLVRHCSQSHRMVTEPRRIVPLTYEELKKFTDNFSAKNCIGRFQVGKLYHGVVESDSAAARFVTVKMWEPPFEYYNYTEGDNEMRMMDEYALLRHRKLNCHPAITAMNVALHGWTELRWLLELLTSLCLCTFKIIKIGPFVIRNIEPSHILVDKDYNPKLCDFGLIAGGIFGHKRCHTRHINGCLGSIDHRSKYYGFTSKTDVHNFGLLLMKLMSNEIDDVVMLENNTVTCWESETIFERYKGSNGTDVSMMSSRSMMDPSLRDDETFFPKDGVEMSKLAGKCIIFDVSNRPTMEQVLASLLELQIVKKYYDELGIEGMVMKIKEEQ